MVFKIPEPACIGLDESSDMSMATPPAVSRRSRWRLWLVYETGGSISNIAASAITNPGAGTDQGGIFKIPAGHEAIGHPVGVGVHTTAGWPAIDDVRLSLNVVSGSEPLDSFGIISIMVSGGNATLTWESQAGATYSILSKTNLNAESWTPVTNGISSAGNTATAESVPVNGADKVFYKVEGQK